MKNLAWVGQCPVCVQGRQVIARENDTEKMYVVCEDCESEWDTPQDAKAKKAPSRDIFGASTFLSRDEIAGHPWEEFLAK